MLTGVFRYFPQVLPGKCRKRTSNRPRPLPSKCCAIHQSSYCPALYSLDADSVVRQSPPPQNKENKYWKMIQTKVFVLNRHIETILLCKFSPDKVLFGGDIRMCTNLDCVHLVLIDTHNSYQQSGLMRLQIITNILRYDVLDQLWGWRQRVLPNRHHRVVRWISTDVSEKLVASILNTDE
jgi:hypothetical protein